jgi:acyl-CoA thioester hydrolase
MPSSRRPLLVQLPFQVKTYDIDFAGHVSNIVYVRWLEDLRLAMLESYLPLKEQMEGGVVPLLVESSVRYRLQIGLLAEVTGCMWVEDLTAVRVKVRAEFVHQGNVCVEAFQTGAFVDIRTGRPARVPQAFRRQVFSSELVQ